VKHRITLSDEEIAIIETRIEKVTPVDYDLHTYALLRNLYGRFLALRTQAKVKEERERQ